MSPGRARQRIGGAGPDHGFRLILFDCDGTLVDSQHFIVATMAAAFAQFGLAAPTPATIRRLVGLRLEDVVASLRPADAAVSADELADAYRREAIAARTRPGYAEPLFPGIREALDHIDGPEVWFGIATGKRRRGLLHTLESHGLRDRFVTLQTADDNPGKPHPAMVERAMREVGVDAADTALIGDTSFDMQMACHAGVAALGVEWGYHSAQELRAAGARALVSQPDDLANALTALTGR